jgi:hypothetical protein
MPWGILLKILFVPNRASLNKVKKPFIKRGDKNEGRNNRCNDAVCVAGKMFSAVVLRIFYHVHHYYVGSLDFRMAMSAYFAKK